MRNAETAICAITTKVFFWYAFICFMKSVSVLYNQLTWIYSKIQYLHPGICNIVMLCKYTTVYKEFEYLLETFIYCVLSDSIKSSQWNSDFSALDFSTLRDADSTLRPVLLYRTCFNSRFREPIIEGRTGEGGGGGGGLWHDSRTE